jgi:lysophospholipase L1-like esterase
VLPTLVDHARGDGAQVVLVGYYAIPSTANLGFGACEAWLPRLRARQAALADARPGVFYVDPSASISEDTAPEAYRSDDIHPTRDGSARVGRLAAEVIRGAEAK